MRTYMDADQVPDQPKKRRGKKVDVETLDVFATVPVRPLPKDSVPYAPNSEASYEAAQRIKSAAKGMLQRVDDYFDQVGNKGACRPEIERALNMKTPTVCARMDDLIKQKRIRKLSQNQQIVKREHCTVYVRNHSRGAA